MATAEIVLVVVSVLILALRAARLFGLRVDHQAAKTTFEEPALKLDAPAKQPHDLFGELQSTLEADKDADERYLDAGERDAQLSRRIPVARKVLFTAGCIALLVGLPYVHPSLSWLQVLTARDSGATEATPPAGGPLPSASVGEAKLPGATYDQQARAKDLDAQQQDSRGPIARGGKAADEPKIGPAVAEDKPPRPIDDPSGKALEGLFAKLVRVENKEAGSVARILYFGDSIVASDFVTGKLRRMLQTRFGDAGHGYAIIANAWPGWFHIDVSRKASAEWRVSTCVGPYAKDGLYGLGCASFTSYHKGIWSEFATASLDQWGRNVSSFELEYLAQPGGGAIDLIIDGDQRERLSTAGDEPKVSWHRVTVPDGPHRLKIEAADDKPVRVHGIRMERDVPGVTLSALGITGARARFLDKQDDGHWASVIRAAKPDLVCLAFGSNEITDGNMFPMDKYRETLSAVMKQVETAVPKASLMLVGPPDMASNNAAWGHSRPMVHYIVKNQKELAAERGWAFWDQYRAMGGTGSMWAWMQAGLGSKDLFHPTGQGGNMLGTWEYLALMQAFEQYKAVQR